MKDVEIAKSIRHLLENEDFVNVFIEEYVNNGIKHLVLNEDVNDENVRIKLKAIKEFRDFIEYYVTLEKK